MAAKKCSKCGEEKPLDNFSKHPGCKDGHRPDCKTCAYAAARARLKPGQHAEYNRRYRARNPSANRDYYAKNKARIVLQQTEYTRRNRDAYNARLRAWRKANPEKVQVWVRNRRAKLKGSKGSHTLDDIKALMESQSGKCVYCLCDIRLSFQVDHIVPVALGGANDKVNLQLLCKPCNLDKRDKDPVEYLKTRSLKKEDENNGRRSEHTSGLV
jgi:5-methylcytosine-specific restriction endonuclease McrA